MVKFFADIVWILSSLAPYYIFFILSKKSFFDEKILFIPTYILIVLLIGISCLLTKMAIHYFYKNKSEDTLLVSNIKPAEATYVPLYISYFIIAIGIDSLIVFEICSLLLIVLIYKTKIYYFNPIVYFFNYNFYEVVSDKGVSFLVISKQKNLKQIKEFNNLCRLNNFSFIDRG
ncbi:MAG: hypothetical protein LBV16_02350 [Elusimicrobiota bacterium]|jgi:hypothetical protein|nr:hypothetical protein [Elusimicrobiota bacterium]